MFRNVPKNLYTWYLVLTSSWIYHLELGINKVDVFQSSTRIVDPGILIRISLIFFSLDPEIKCQKFSSMGTGPCLPICLLVFSIVGI